MGVIIVGRRLYGSVDRVPGLCHVATMFLHWSFLPLFPLGTFIVEEGSEEGTFFESSFQGPRVGLHLKSVLVGYFRGWVGAMALLFFPITALIIPLDLGSKLLLNGGPIVVGLMVALVFLTTLGAGFGTFFVLATRRNTWIVVQTLLHLGSAAAWLAVSQAANPLMRTSPKELAPFLALENVTLIAYSLTRLFDRAGYARAVRLGKELGVDADTIEDLLYGPYEPPSRRRTPEVELEDNGADQDADHDLPAKGAITVRCPGCRTSYRLEKRLRGKKVRCMKCREVFPVNEAAEWKVPFQEESIQPKRSPARKPRKLADEE